MVPYKWDNSHSQLEGVYCIFNPHFFVDFGDIQKYEVFQPKGVHVFELEDEGVIQVNELFEKIESTFQSEYKYKFDLIACVGYLSNPLSNIGSFVLGKTKSQ